MRTGRLLTLLFLTFLATAFAQAPNTTAGGAPVAPAWIAQADAYLEREIGESSLTGAAVAVVSGDELLYARGFGASRRDGGVAVTPDTVFEIGSLTKSMTALAILQLAEDGLLELDDPVREHLPWFRVADEAASEQITLRHLLTHTSGLPATSHAVVWQDFDRIENSVEEGVRALRDVELAHAPGGELEYANTGYATLGLVIEAVSGLSWSDYLAAELLQPLGMNRSGLTLADQSRFELAVPHTWRLGTLQPTVSPAAFMGPAGSTPVSTVTDMGRYLQAWLRPAESGPITPTTVARATTAEAPYSGDAHYGLGLIVGEQHGERVVYHTGGTVGSSTYLTFLPEHDLGVVVLSNGLSALPPQIGRGLVDIALGEAPRDIGNDPARVISVVNAVLGALGLALLGLLAWRLAAWARRGAVVRRAPVLYVRAALLTLLAAGMWVVVPMILELAGMPMPFGVFGYTLDMLVGAVALLLPSTLWAAYALATLGVALTARRRPAPRPTGRVMAAARIPK